MYLRGWDKNNTQKHTHPPIKKLSPAAAGRTPLFPSSKRKQNRIFLRAVRPQPQKEKDVCHITSKTMRCFAMLQFASERLNMAKYGRGGGASNII